MFVGRRRELEALEQAFAQERSALVPVYGRRRVGKSELILKFLKGKPAVYVVGKQAPAALQVREFLTQAATALDEPLIASQSVAGWEEALDSVVSRWRGDGKLVVALDEFQWMAGASPELPSVLQALWDRRWSKSGRVLLILCGSYVGFMEREVLGPNSPLFGRRTAQIQLKPFRFSEAAGFHPGYSDVERARAYFVCGGVPLYLRAFDPARSVDQNIRRVVLDEYGVLHREPDFLLREELREVETYHAVLTAIAGGRSMATEIAAAASVGDRALQYYLQQLMALGYVRRRHPLTGSKPGPRAVRYDLDDPLLRFWFRFVFPNLSYLAAAGPERAFADLIAPGLDAYFGSCFERLCREMLPLIYRTEQVATSFEVGEYWDRTTQIDVVGLREDGVTDLGECKWGAARAATALVAELEQKVAAYPNARNATIFRRLFVRSAPRTGGHRTVRWHTLSDLARLD
jgi:hypothetical protein